jgi:hypothetical protein
MLTVFSFLEGQSIYVISAQREWNLSNSARWVNCPFSNADRGEWIVTMTHFIEQSTLKNLS